MKVLNKLLFCAGLLSVSSVMATEVVTPVGAGCDTEDGTCYILLKENIVSSNCPYKNQIRLSPNKNGSAAQYSTGLELLWAEKGW